MHGPVALLVLSLIVACGSSAPRATPTPATQAASPTAPAASSDIAPRPFTPEQIAAAMPVGTSLTFRFEPAGKPAYVETWTVTAADAQTGTIATRREHADGRVETEPPGPATWSDYANHASFPANATTISDSEITTPAGTFATRLYVVTKDGAVHRYHFAPSLPGPPVQLEIEQDGAVAMKMTMIAREPAAPR
jgi:hypothetical protein